MVFDDQHLGITDPDQQQREDPGTEVTQNGREPWTVASVIRVATNFALRALISERPAPISSLIFPTASEILCAAPDELSLAACMFACNTLMSVDSFSAFTFSDANCSDQVWGASRKADCQWLCKY